MAVRVNHTVVATGYLVSDGEASILFQGDSGPTRELWNVANAASRLQAIIVETSYPNALQDLADASGHLTPQTLRTELTKLTVGAPIYAQHIKPQFISDVVRELAELSDPPVAILEQGKEYSFLTP
jgi:ribonuclease BN (tRNA processing enzyme)